MTLSTSLALVAGLVAAIALVKARAAANRADELSDAYWQLRYEYGQLASKVRRLEEAGLSAPPEEASSAPAVATAFVPLSSLKR